MGRRVYLASEMAVYYPGERMFAPDLLAVLDVETHEREKWVVDIEGKGPDLALEIVVSGRRRKDLEANVERYARLGIPEYFVFDRARLRLSGFRLPPGGRAYQPILPQAGRYGSVVLGLDLILEGERLRFFQGTAPLLEADELIGRLERMLDDLEDRLEEVEGRARAAEARAEEEAQKRAEEAQKRAEVEQRLAEALAAIERLRGPRR